MVRKPELRASASKFGDGETDGEELVAVPSGSWALRAAKNRMRSAFNDGGLGLIVTPEKNTRWVGLPSTISAAGSSSAGPRVDAWREVIRLHRFVLRRFPTKAMTAKRAKHYEDYFLFRGAADLKSVRRLPERDACMITFRVNVVGPFRLRKHKGYVTARPH